jgi:hypothetical protein
MRSTLMEIQDCERVAHIPLAALRLVVHSLGVRVCKAEEGLCFLNLEGKDLKLPALKGIGRVRT